MQRKGVINLDENNRDIPLALEPAGEDFEPQGQTAPREGDPPPFEEASEEATQGDDNQNLEEQSGEFVEEEGTHTLKHRVREQSERIRAQREEINTLRSQLSNLSGENLFDDNPAPTDLFKPTIQPGQEISVDQYQTDVARTADALVTLRLKQTQNANRIKSEIIDSINEHPELNDRSDSFDQDLSDTMLEAVGSFVKANPTGDVKGYINKMMKPYKRSIEKGINRQTEAAVKQASQQALRPTQAHGSSKKFADLSVAEMEEKLGKVY